MIRHWFADKTATVGFIATWLAVWAVIGVAFVASQLLRVRPRRRPPAEFGVDDSNVDEWAWTLRHGADSFEPAIGRVRVRPSPLLHDAPHQPVSRLRVSRPVLELAAADMATPVFDELAAQWPEILGRRIRALRTPTMEMRAMFDEITADMEIDWRCLHCRADEHQDCPACSCPCSLVEVAA